MNNFPPAGTKGGNVYRLSQ